MAKILLSYRRADTRAVVGRVYDRLAAYYGPQALFLDVDDIPYGSDFRVHIAEVMRETDVVVALMGEQWRGETAAGARILDERDPVRVEIEAALEGGIALVPVLVDGAIMPAAEALPASISALSYRNAVALSTGRDFDQHVRRLIAAIDLLLGSKAPVAAVSASHGPLDVRSPLPYVVVAGALLPMVAAWLGFAPPWPGGSQYFTVALEAILLGSMAAALNGVSRGTLRRLVTTATIVLVAGGMIYLAGFNTFTYVTPTTGEHWVKGYVCTPEALSLPGYKEKCPFLDKDELKDAEYEAQRLWTLPSITVVKVSLAAIWFASFAAIAVLGAAIIAGFRPAGRSS